ncbi:hypothetical protein KR018_001547 [Drosophila ironensis]|nr:hypothetical protein KR018_001547 [Drosophila ironensis]
MRDQATAAEAPTMAQKWIVCRVCLRQPKEPMASIFNDESAKDMTHMIMECGGVPIKKFDHYPDKICEKCSRALKVAFKFRQTCQNSYKHLRQFVAPVEEEQEQEQEEEQEQAVKKAEQEEEAETAAEETEEELDEVNFAEPEPDADGDGEADAEEVQVNAFSEELAEGILVELEKERILQVKSEHVKNESAEEEGFIEEVYDVYETFDGDIISDQTAYEEDIAEQSLSGLSADIEYLDQVEHDQDQLTESANEDDDYVPSKSSRSANRSPAKRRLSTRKAATSQASESISGTSKSAGVRGNAAKVRRIKTEEAAADTEEGLSIGEALARKHDGVKTKGGHKILVGDKKEFKYICDVCGNMYPSQSRLTEHIKVHSGIKPHECEICGHCFAQAQQLARHMNTHTGNRPYKCSYCPAAFADLSTRNKHHRIHTNERPYECDVCHKTFTYTNTLKFHKMIHTGEKPHVCDVCGKGFPQAYKLRNHRVIHERRSVRDAVDQILPYDTANIVGLEM